MRNLGQHFLEFGWMNEKRDLILVTQSSCDCSSQLVISKQRQCNYIIIEIGVVSAQEKWQKQKQIIYHGELHCMSCISVCMTLHVQAFLRLFKRFTFVIFWQTPLKKPFKKQRITFEKCILNLSALLFKKKPNHFQTKQKQSQQAVKFLIRFTQCVKRATVFFEFNKFLFFFKKNPVHSPSIYFIGVFSGLKTRWNENCWKHFFLTGPKNKSKGALQSNHLGFIYPAYMWVSH